MSTRYKRERKAVQLMDRQISETSENIREVVKKRISEAVFKLMERDPLIGYMVYRTWIYFDEKIPTAATDGLNIYVNPKFFYEAPDKTIKFILAHEVLHILNRHYPRYTEYLSTRGLRHGPLLRFMSNVVMDAIVNETLKDYFEKPVEKLIYCRELASLSEGAIREQECLTGSFEELMDKWLESLKKKGIHIQSGSWGGGPVQPVPTDDYHIGPPPDFPVSSPSTDYGESEEECRGGRCPRPRGTRTGRGGVGEKEGEEGEISREEGGKSGEEYRKLLDKLKKAIGDKLVELPERDPREHGFGEKSDKDIAHEGDSEDRDVNTGDTDEVKKRVGEKALEIHEVIRKTAGTIPGWFKRIVEEILKPRVNWREVLRAFIRNLPGFSFVRRTWTRVSRKLPGLHPGKVMYRRGKVLTLVDTSGSISDRELKQFISELYWILRELGVKELVVIPWDAEAYKPIVIRNPAEFMPKINAGVKGGGGTVIAPALKLVDKEPKLKIDTDYIIILSDWEIFDLDEEETQNLLRKYSNKIVAVTTSNEPPAYLKYRLKLDLKSK